MEYLIENQTIEGFGAQEGVTYYGAATEAYVALELGKTYVITWDGVEYTCIAQDLTVVAEGAVGVGNISLLIGGDSTGEPFAIAYADMGEGNLINAWASTDTTSTAHTVSVALYEAPREGIVLKDRNGNDVAYYGIETVTFDTTTEGKQQTYTKGVIAEGVVVELAMSDGDQTIQAPEGYLVKEATIKKPETLLPENIRKNENVAGIVGTFEGNFIENVEITPDFSEGDQTFSAPDGYGVKSGVIKKPENLLPENIKDGENVAGIVGTHKGGGEMNDENLLNFAYTIDTQESYISVIAMNAERIIETSSDPSNVYIPDTIAGYSVSFDGQVNFSNRYGSLRQNVPYNIVFGQNVISRGGNASHWFYADRSLYGVENLPHGITDMSSTFMSCYNLRRQVNIPDSVVSMYRAFANCSNYNHPIEVPANVETVFNAFQGMSNLNKPITFRSEGKLTNMFGFLMGCRNFNQPITIPNGVTNMGSALSGCYNFRQHADIPDSVVDLRNCFGYSNNVPTVNIGRGAQNLAQMFERTSNTTDVWLYSNEVTNVQNMFAYHNTATKYVNLHVFAGSNTNTLIYNNGNGALAGTIRWTTTTNGYYNSTYKINVYYDLTDE